MATCWPSGSECIQQPPGLAGLLRLMMAALLVVPRAAAAAAAAAPADAAADGSAAAADADAAAAAPAAAAPAEPTPPVAFSHHVGALMSGGDLGKPKNLTTAGAIAYCSSLPACAGFTFECAGGASACAGTSDGPLKTYFKSVTAGNTDASWWTYIKQRSKVFAQSFGSHMVLQHTRPCLWGFGHPGASVTLKVNNTIAASTTVATNGSWQACLPMQQASHAPAVISATVGTDQEELTDCLFGEVWVASGQSNMAFAVSQAFNNTAECEAAGNYPSLRLFSVAVNFDWQKTHSGEPSDFNQSGIRQQWSVSGPDSACGGGDFDFFSAVAFFFCRDLQAHLGVPVGCVATSVPGTNIELWSSSAALAQCPLPHGSLPEPNWSALWEAMVAPLTRMSVAGFIWYQVRVCSSCPYSMCARRPLVPQIMLNWLVFGRERAMWANIITAAGSRQ